MFFEGSEKKIEAIVKEDINLREYGHSFWRKIVKECRAEVLSYIENDQVTAYLLSESSLFVWRNRFLMITCGQTVLANSAIKFVEEVGADKIESLIFQRKNEYDSRLQSTSFREDVRELAALIPGKAYRLGHLDAHHTFLFHSDVGESKNPEDVTSEFLMYNLTGAAANILQTPNLPKDVIRSLLGLEKLLPDYEIDDFMFTPFGYSMNAIKGDKYATIHITPQEVSSYVSFETNEDESVCSPMLQNVLQVFAPRSFDLVTFNYKKKPDLSLSGSLEIGQYRDNIHGYDISFGQYVTPEMIASSAVTLF